VLHQKEGITIEYIEICDAHSFENLDTIKTRAVLAIACRIGKTRLIDNTILTEA
jgi:pantothenate synthetase